MPQQDRMFVEFLDNGLIKVTTDEISGPNHMSAEEFITFLARGQGGAVERSRRTDKQGMSHHEHTHEHTHEH